MRLTFTKVLKASVAASWAYRMDASSEPVAPARMTGIAPGLRGGDDSCGREGGIDGEGESEAQVTEGPIAKVGRDGRGVGVKELVHPCD